MQIRCSPVFVIVPLFMTLSDLQKLAFRLLVCGCRSGSVHDIYVQSRLTGEVQSRYTYKIVMKAEVYVSLIIFFVQCTTLPETTHIYTKGNKKHQLFRLSKKQHTLFFLTTTRQQNNKNPNQSSQQYNVLYSQSGSIFPIYYRVFSCLYMYICTL